MNIRSWAVASALLGIFAAGAFAADPGKITIDGSSPGAKIGPLFYGLMTEEINHSYDGGLYAELIQNRIFQDKKDPVCWSAVGDGSISIDEANPVNSGALKRSLKLTLSPTGSRVGLANTGFYGIPVWPNTKYHASFYAQATDEATGPLTVTIESNDGSITFATATTSAITADWKKYEVTLTTADVAKSTGNRFVISSTGKGSVWFSLVSLFPPTYHDRPNGNRIDVMEKLADMHPSFLRFPGGNFLEGDTIASRFKWKETIGPLENRPGHQGCWSYHVSDGLGLLEFLGWCEDLKMEPLLAVYAGYSLRGAHVNPGKDLQPFVTEALEEIEYCTGGADTVWGKRRAADGHPAPFKIHYIEIGNEDWFDKSGTYDGRFSQIYKAIKAKYPTLKCIATARAVHSVTPDLYDDHDYPSPKEMLRKSARYDDYGSEKPKVFFGEWATQDGRPTPTMRAALADAAWLTALQRDSDTVLLNCYAPLLVNVNKGAWQWPTNLIGYDAANSFGSPSFYAQCMFAKAWGDTNLSTKVESQNVKVPTMAPPQGFIGVGTWKTNAQYKDVKVTSNGQTLFASDFNTGIKGWRPTTGNWEVKDGALAQSDLGEADRMTAGDGHWQDYTVSLKAKKTGGAEGFLVLFHVRDDNNYQWFNIGGWGNTQTSLEDCANGSKTMIGEPVDFKVQTDKWYDVRVELKGLTIKCYVDEKLILQATQKPAEGTETLFAAASKVDATGEVILKVVNTINAPQQVEINLAGLPAIAPDAAAQVLQGDPNGQNTVESPTKIAPTEEQITDAGTKFTHEFPANSVTVIHLKPAKN